MFSNSANYAVYNYLFSRNMRPAITSPAGKARPQTKHKRRASRRECTGDARRRSGHQARGRVDGPLPSRNNSRGSYEMFGQINGFDRLNLVQRVFVTPRQS